VWNLVVKLLWELNGEYYFTTGYADDSAILFNGKFLQTVSQELQTALGIVQRW
jgi:hypothetical protein